VLRNGEASASVQLSRVEFSTLLTGLAEKSYLPAALESQRRFAELAGIDDPSAVREIRLARAGSIDADVFFRGDCIYYIYNAARSARRGQAGDLIFERAIIEGYYDPANYQPRIPGREGILVAGVIITKATPEELQSELKDFLSVIEETVKSTRKVEEGFEWKITVSKDSLQELNERLRADDAPLRFSHPEVEPPLQAGAIVLANPPARSLLREVGEAGFVRETDLLSRRGRKEEEVRGLLEQLKAASLVETQFLLQCRKNSAPLTRLVTEEQLNEIHVAGLLCPTCSRRFDKELLNEGYLVSDLGRRLLDSSHWMTVWVTLKLMEIGISTESIMWNLEESGEEVDILVGFLGDLWVFELKDREFGPGDAHPFRYRQTRYKANAAIIISTDKVSSEAKRIFAELARAAGDSPKAGEPLYIEGLESVSVQLNNLMDETATHRAIQSLQIPSAATSFNIGAVLRTKVKHC